MPLPALPLWLLIVVVASLEHPQLVRAVFLPGPAWLLQVHHCHAAPAPWHAAQMARLMFGRAADPPEDQHSHLLALLACGLISAATVALGLEVGLGCG